MIIAKTKKKENIAEYILYMWQIEYLIRIFSLDIEKIDNEIIQKFEQPDSLKIEMLNWYSGLIEMMKEENKIEKGHLQININILNDLYNLHLRLISNESEQDYKKLYALARPVIDELTIKLSEPVSNEVEACFNALYGVLMLRIQNKIISPETAGAMQHISRFIAVLSKKYKQIENGEVEF